MAHRKVGWLDEHEQFVLPILEPISLHFSIPRLDDKPQDPIVRAIHTVPRHGAPLHDSPTATLSPTTLSRAKGSPDTSIQTPKSVLTSLWDEPHILQSRDVGCPLSWDPTSPLDNCAPFLTEQHSAILACLQNRPQPGLHAKSTKAGRFPCGGIFTSLHLAVLGTSSPLYVWDLLSQSFVQAVLPDVHDSLAEATDNGMPPSILLRFLNLGSLVRRLERLIRELRGRRGRANTTVHAFAHGLSSILMFIRNRLSYGPLCDVTSHPGLHCLATVWKHYAELEQVVNALASMCSRSMDISPETFSEIPDSPVDLLNLVYESFEMHVDRHSPRHIIAIMAYLLTVSSKPYIRTLSRLLAYGEMRTLHTVASDRPQFMDITSHFDGDEGEVPWRGEEISIDSDGPFPRFIPENLANIFPAAHKSLKLLEAAKPDHPIFSAELPSKVISWIWTKESIENLWNGIADDEDHPAVKSPRSPPLESQTPDDGDLMAGFKVFELEPGTLSSSERDSQAVLDEFIVDFPNALPIITPSPILLCEVMFRPLRDHATSLSRALLAVFLDQSSLLCIDAHLQLLRSHMLLTSHSFKLRLAAALFSDVEDRVNQSVQLYNLLRYKAMGTTSDESHTGRWPVGLAPLLVTRDTWPPGGSELSFLLRTVIVDSQQNNFSSVDSPSSDLDGARRVMSEAESRLGFAVRELGNGKGHNRWLNPLSIEALDFLYLDYKVPEPLQALIPTVVLSKYQRIFALLLRLMRVECAIRSVFRLTRAAAVPLFPTLLSSRKLLLGFRFAAHSFLSTLSTYIYDTAIGGNFDAFLQRIEVCRHTSDASSGFRDVFSLAECHSSVLDDILSACLLRSSQRTAGDLLRGTLEVVLEFCVLVGDLKDGRLAEYQASSVLERLYGSFRKKVSSLTRALETMLEHHGKGQSTEQLHWAAYPDPESRVPPGGIDAIRRLLTCLNQNDWWTQ